MNAPAHRKEWLPVLNPDFAPRLNGLLKPGSVIEGAESAEPLAHAVLEDAIQSRATDIHLEPFSLGWRARMRVDGRMHDVAQLSEELGSRLARYFRTSANLDPVAAYLPQDAGLHLDFGGHKIDLRLATTPCFGGQTLALRLLDPTRLQRRIRDLGLEEADLKGFEGMLRNVTGMCLVTGPTGSGKTTTLYALLHELELSNYSIVTIEDPVEYPIDGITQIQVDLAHGLTLARGLRSMLRLDPDYLLVGEIRDPESAQVTVEAAATGLFAMSTLHSPDTAGIVTLMRNWNIPDHQIATVLQIVVNQRLVRRLCTKCRVERSIPDEAKAWLEAAGLPVPKTVWKPVGCEACRKTGYWGRIGVFEVWHKDESDYDAILQHADEHALRSHLRRRGLRSVIEDGLAKVRNGVTSLSEVQRLGVPVGNEHAKRP